MFYGGGESELLDDRGMTFRCLCRGFGVGFGFSSACKFVIALVLRGISAWTSIFVFEGPAMCWLDIVGVVSDAFFRPTLAVCVFVGDSKFETGGLMAALVDASRTLPSLVTSVG